MNDLCTEHKYSVSSIAISGSVRKADFEQSSVSLEVSEELPPEQPLYHKE